MYDTGTVCAVVHICAQVNYSINQLQYFSKKLKTIQKATVFLITVEAEARFGAHQKDRYRNTE